MVGKFLITGFEPYGGMTFNPTELIVNELSGFQDAGVETALLPTSYGDSEAEIVKSIQLVRPATLVMLGLKRGASCLHYERFARNLDDSIAPDNDGVVRIRKKIITGAPSRYSNTLPYDILVECAAGCGESVEISEDAGGYVCNHAYFIAAHFVATKFPSCRFGFIHVPSLTKSSDRMARMVQLVRRWTSEINQLKG